MIHQPELLDQIFFHLPAKSIARFRCVSKSCNSLLSQPQYIKTHLNRIKQYPIQEQSLILVSAATELLYTVNLTCAHQLFDEMPKPPLQPTELNLGDHRFLHDDIRDLASCDGLVLVEDTKSNLILINPTTREIKELPETPNDRRLLSWITLFGIGYDSTTDDYKMVTISSYFMDLGHHLYYEDDEVKVNVYSVKNGTWKALNNHPLEFDHEDGIDSGGVYLSGHIHWIARNLRKRSAIIAAFDIKAEKFWELSLPVTVSSSVDSMTRIVIIEGCLCLFPHWLKQDYVCFVMKEYGVNKSWTTKFTNIVSHENSGVRPLCLLGEDQMVLLMDEEGDHEKLVIYNVQGGISKDVEIQGYPGELAIKGTFVESLLSPHYVYYQEDSNEE